MKLQGTESKAASGIPHENPTPHFTDIKEGFTGTEHCQHRGSVPKRTL